MSKLIGLRIVTKHGAFLNMVMPEDEANKYLDDWYRVMNDECCIMHGTSSPVPGIQNNSQKWMVRVTEIAIMHTFDVAELRAQNIPQQPFAPSFPRKS